jgi:hypothetical protein
LQRFLLHINLSLDDMALLGSHQGGAHEDSSLPGSAPCSSGVC